MIVLGGGVVERESNRKLLIDWAKTKGPIIHVCRQLEDVFFYLKSKQTKSTWGVFEEEYKTRSSLFPPYLVFHYKFAHSHILNLDNSLGTSSIVVPSMLEPDFRHGV